MSQLGEQFYFKPEPAKETAENPKNKKPIVIRIILFCDGTNNNKYNIENREKFEAGTEGDTSANTEFGGQGSSYDNGRTNIAAMEPHVLSGANIGPYDYIAKCYVGGSGTFNFEKDSEFFGKGMGAWGSGVYWRAREIVDDVEDELRDGLLPKKPADKYFIQRVDVDVFGFSRGAATARHAIHVLTETEYYSTNNPAGYGDPIRVMNYPLCDRLTNLGYEPVKQPQINIIFAGLYDTVVSVNASQLLPAWLANNMRTQRAVKKARCAVHFAAADEHRADFSLYRITSAKKAGKGAEYYLPGVHSDIGGSYNLANEILLEEGQENPGATIKQLIAEGDPDVMANRAVELSKLGEKTSVVVAKWGTTRAGKYPLVSRLYIHKTMGGTVNELIAEGEYLEIKKQADELKQLGQRASVVETAWASTRAGRHPSGARLYLIKRVDELEYARPTAEINHIINRDTVKNLKIDRNNLIKNGWYKPEEIRIEFDTTTELATFLRGVFAVTNPIGIANTGLILGKLVVTRTNIQTAYCTLPLKFMVEHSRNQSIQIDPKLDNRITKILGQFAEFAAVEAALRSYMDKKGPTGSKPDDWYNVEHIQKEYPGLNITELRHRHFHMSSAFKYPVIDPGFTPRFEGHLRRRFYYDG